jgi:hypothetical protein
MLRLSQNRKIMGVKGERNSIGLPVIKTCPGATEVCKSVCYAKKGFMAFDNAQNMYEENYKAIKFNLMMGGIKYCAEQLATEIKKYNKSGFFRWQISGDIFSYNYGWVVKEVAKLLPEIKFWIYTRSFHYISPGAAPNNLQIIASFDKENCDKYKYFIFWKVLPSYMGTLEEAKAFLPDKKWITCPQQLDKIELTGACIKCKLCISPKPNTGIHFIIK